MQNDLDTIQTKERRKRKEHREREIYDHRQDKKKGGRAQRRKDLILFL